MKASDLLWLPYVLNYLISPKVVWFFLWFLFIFQDFFFAFQNFDDNEQRWQRLAKAWCSYHQRTNEVSKISFILIFCLQIMKKFSDHKKLFARLLFLKLIWEVTRAINFSKHTKNCFVNIDEKMSCWKEIRKLSSFCLAYMYNVFFCFF